MINKIVPLLIKILVPILVPVVAAVGLVSRVRADVSPSSGSLIKIACSIGASTIDPCRTVYYYHGPTRHAFINERVFKSWYPGSVSILEMSAGNLNAIPPGKYVPYKPGSRLLKNFGNPKVYAVDDNADLCWIPNEIEARRLYGYHWPTQVDELSSGVLAQYRTVPQPSDGSYNIDTHCASISTMSKLFARNIAWTTPVTTASAPLPTPSPTPTPAPTAPSTTYDIGSLPSGLTINWPTAPRITRDVEARNSSEFNAAAAVPGSRITVRANLPGSLRITASDIQVNASGMSLGLLTIERSVKRVSLQGGTYQTIHAVLPTVWWPTQESRPEWMVEDLMVNGVRVVTTSTGGDEQIAFNIAGRRIAIIRSSTSARTYSVWSGSSSNIPSEDIILAGNNFVSDGPEATVRLVNVRRSVSVDNRLTNGTPDMSISKHNFRIHGTASNIYVARNVLVHSGTMNGNMDGDSVDRMWFVNNTFYQLRPDLFNFDRNRVRSLVANDNHAYTDIHTVFTYNTAPTWTLSNNQIHAYRVAP